MANIQTPLQTLFETHRIVFWYDDKVELRHAWEALVLDGVEKVEILNNQFGLKHRILIQEPNRKFLLYHAGPAPDHTDNWLLDLELANKRFYADQAAMWLTDLGLPVQAFRPLVEEHVEFFKSGKRVERLGKLLEKADELWHIKLKMLAVCASVDARLDAIIYALLDELAAEKSTKLTLIKRVGLAPFLWDRLQRGYGYVPEGEIEPGLEDFAITLFVSGMAHALTGEETPALDTRIIPLLQNWQDSSRHQASFKTLSETYAAVQIVKSAVERHSASDLADVTLFEAIDRKIVAELVHTVANRTMSASAVHELIDSRRRSVWYDTYEPLYRAVRAAADFLAEFEAADLTIDSLHAGPNRYTQEWFRIDQFYRHFIAAAKASHQATLLDVLKTKIDEIYSDQYLYKLGHNWQHWVDGLEKWSGFPYRLQSEFYNREVGLYSTGKNKLFVIISDALRYEVGEELASRIRSINRFSAKVDGLISHLPSFTQLGMAALLPHNTLSFKPGDPGAILADGKPTAGLVNRNKILDRWHHGAAAAFQAKDIINSTREERRKWFDGKTIIYIYQNKIDARGDSAKTEEEVFAAADETLDELVKLVQKLAYTNASNLIVTADHGFIYQDQVLDESEFMTEAVDGALVQAKNRRFTLGNRLQGSDAYKQFSSEDVGLEPSDTEIMIPKSIGRTRIKGAGSRYVHGGASLQEIIVPVIRIQYSKEDDTGEVDVVILQGGSATITTGQFTITLYQSEAVTEKRHPRTLRVGVYNQQGQLISNQETLHFDKTSDQAADREERVQFILTSAAAGSNGQEIIVKLEEQIGNTSQFKEYKTKSYFYRQSFTSDFDF